jgi:hypothetical protein
VLTDVTVPIERRFSYCLGLTTALSRNVIPTAGVGLYGKNTILSFG